MAENGKSGNGVRKELEVKVVLLDIEGTTTAITFVKEKLFPYASDSLEGYLQAHWKEEQCKKDVDRIRKQLKADEEEGRENVPQIPSGPKDKVLNGVVEGVKWLMAADRKVTALKELQGHIWRHGYQNGDLHGHVYADVAPTLKTWHEQGFRVCIYSSGSVEAQKLLFQYSVEGDLLPYFSGHFDTNIGSKREHSSYLKIAEELNVDPQDVLFLTDIPSEAAAARQAGMMVKLVTRPKNAPLSDEERQEYDTISTLTELTLTRSHDNATAQKRSKKDQN